MRAPGMTTALAILSGGFLAVGITVFASNAQAPPASRTAMEFSSMLSLAAADLARAPK